MSFKEVLSLDADITIALGGKNKQTGKANPKTAEGYYLGTRQVDGGKRGKSNIHFLQTSEGNLGVWGKTDLDRKLQTVATGTMIRITQTGMQATPNGDMYKFKVEQDSSNTIDVSGLQAANQGGGNDSETETTDEDEAYASASTDDEDEYQAELEEEVEEAPRVVAKTSNADATARKAKVQALLAKGNKRVG